MRCKVNDVGKIWINMEGLEKWKFQGKGTIGWVLKGWLTIKRK